MPAQYPVNNDNEVSLLKKIVNNTSEITGDGGTTSADLVSVADAGGFFTGANAESVLQQVGQEIASLQAGTVTPPTGNTLLSGGGVGYVSGLDVTVGEASYIIQGVNYTSPLTNLTAAAADPTNPRIDVVAVNSSGASIIITGTPAATPVKPDVDPATQLELTFYLLGASATTIPVTSTDIYLDGTEWTMTKVGAPINLTSASNPYTGTVDIEATAAVSGNSFTATVPAAGTFDIGTYNTLFFYIRNKASWSNSKSISIQLLRSGSARGSLVTFKGGTYGFNSQDQFSAYQQIAIPTSSFGANGITCDAIRFTVAGGGGSIGWYIDDITLQSGISPAETSTKMGWVGNYDASRSYNLNEVVLSGGIQYVAIQAGVGHTPASSPLYWQASSSAGTGTVTSVSVTTANGVSGSVATDTTTPAITIALGAITPTSVASSGAISGTNVTGSGIAAFGTTTSATTVLNLPAGTTGVSPFRVAHGSAPTTPVNGDFWSTTAGFFGRVNGVTVGPIGTATAGSGTITSSTTGHIPVYTAATTIAGSSAFTFSSNTLAVTSGSATAFNLTSSGSTSILSISSLNGTNRYIQFQNQGTTHVIMGSAGNTNDLITGTSVDDAVIRIGSGKKILLSVDGGTKSALTFASTYTTNTDGLFEFRGNFTLNRPGAGVPVHLSLSCDNAQDRLVKFQNAGTTYLDIGVAGNANQIITGTAADDTVVRTNGKQILFSTSATGTTYALRFHTGGYIDNSAGAFDFRGNFTIQQAGITPVTLVMNTPNGVSRLISFRNTSTEMATIGSVGDVNVVITGAIADDMVLRTANKSILFSTSSTGASYAMRLQSSGYIDNSAGTFDFRGNFTVKKTSGATTLSVVSPNAVNRVLAFINDSTPNAYIGCAGLLGTLSTNSSADEMVFRTESKIMWWSTDAGVTEAMKLTAAGQLSLTKTTASSSTTTGALIVAGGVGISGAMNVGGVSGLGTAVASSTAVNLPAGTTAISSLRIAHGVAPTTPVNGDMWTTTAGLFVRINGVTVGPLS